MAFQGKLATLYTEFTARGASQVMAATRQIATQVSGLAVASAATATGLAALFTRGAMGDTREADQLASSWEYLSRVVGDIFAPAVRIATAGIFEAAEAFRALSPETKDSIATWTAVGVAAAAAFPIVVAGIMGVGVAMKSVGMLAVGLGKILLSPFTLTVAAIAAVVGAFAVLYDEFTTGGVDLEKSLNSSNESWMGKMIEGFKFITIQGAKAFNQLMTGARDASNWLAANTADVLEYFGLEEEGMGDKIRGIREKYKMPQINIENLSDQFEGFKAALERNVPSLDEFKGKIADLQGMAAGLKMDFGKAWEAAKLPGGGQQFRRKMEVSFEQSDDTWQRIQKALANDPAIELQRAANQELGEIRKILQSMRNEGRTGAPFLTMR